MVLRKLVLSRKGFDTTRRADHPSGRVHPNGGVPSPVFPDGSLYSLPIPGEYDNERPITYGEIRYGDGPGAVNIGRVVEDLTRGLPTPWTADDRAFISPNIRPPLLWQVNGHEGMFAQGVPSQLGHLQGQGVTVGDLFLFFGIFRMVTSLRGRWRFVPRAPSRHILFGWLQVGIIHDDRPEGCGPWFVASERLDLGTGLDAPGFGIFPKVHERLVLTGPGGSASEWRLPRWFYPEPPREPLTCHPSRLWTRDEHHAHVQRRGPGQEFVLDLGEYPEAVDWISNLVRDLGQDA